MIPIPSFAQIKAVYDGVMKAIGFAKEVVEQYGETSQTSSDVLLHKPGRDEVVEKILNGKFARIPGVYKVEIEGKEREIEVKAIVDDMNVFWQFHDIGEFGWWALPESDIQAIKWMELQQVTYD